MRALLIFAGMGLVTYLTRCTMIFALGKEVPALLQRWLRYVPVAVLAALIAPAALAPQGHLQADTRVLAVAVGGLVAWRTRSMLWTFLSGMAAFWLLRALGL